MAGVQRDNQEERESNRYINSNRLLNINLSANKSWPDVEGWMHDIVSWFWHPVFVHSQQIFYALQESFSLQFLW